MYQYLYWCDRVVSLCLCTSIYTDVTVWYHCVYVPVLILMWPCGNIVFMYQYLYWCDRVVILCLCTSIYTDVTVWYYCVYVPVFILMWPCGDIVFMYQYLYWCDRVVILCLRTSTYFCYTEMIWLHRSPFNTLFYFWHYYLIITHPCYVMW
jgi:hypothetical protein